MMTFLRTVLVLLSVMGVGAQTPTPSLTLTASETFTFSLRTGTETFTFSLGTRTETFSLSLGTRTETFTNTLTDSITLSLPTATDTFSLGTRTETFTPSATFSLTETVSLPTATVTFTIPIDCSNYDTLTTCGNLAESGCVWNPNTNACGPWCANVTTTGGCANVAGCKWNELTQRCWVPCDEQNQLDTCGGFRDCSPKMSGIGCEDSCSNSNLEWQCTRQPVDSDNTGACAWRQDEGVCSNVCTDRLQAFDCQSLFDCVWQNNGCAPSQPFDDEDDDCEFLGVACWIWAILAILLLCCCLACIVFCLSKKKKQPADPLQQEMSDPIGPKHEEPDEENQHVYHEFVSPKQTFMTARTAEDQVSEDYPPITNLKDEEPTQSEDDYVMDLTNIDGDGKDVSHGGSNLGKEPPPSAVGDVTPNPTEAEVIPELYDTLPSTEESRFTSPQRSYNPPVSFHRTAEPPPPSFTIPSSAFHRSPPTIDDQDHLYMVI